MTESLGRKKVPWKSEHGSSHVHIQGHDQACANYMVNLSHSDSFQHLSKASFPLSLWIRLWGAVTVGRLNSLARIHGTLPFCESKRTGEAVEARWEGCPFELRLANGGPEMSGDLPKVTQLGVPGLAWKRLPAHWPLPIMLCGGREPVPPNGLTPHLPGEGHPQHCGHFLWAILSLGFISKSGFRSYCSIHECRNNAVVHLSLGVEGPEGTKLETKMGQKKKNPKQSCVDNAAI